MEYILAPVFLVLIAKTVPFGNALRFLYSVRPTQEEKEQVGTTCQPPSQVEVDAAARQDAKIAEILQPLQTALYRIESKVDFILTKLDGSTESTIHNAPVSSEASAIDQ